MKINKYQELAMKTSGSHSPMEFITNGVMGMCGEAGECIDLVKKATFQGHTLDAEKLKDELGDVCWYIASVATGLGIKLEDVFEHNIDKLKKRYPDGRFDAERSINRE